MRALLGCAAIAALMLMSLGIHPAKAVLSYCDLAPENCYYSGDGRLYYMSPGSQLKKAYEAGKVSLPYLIERRRKQQACALHATSGYCRVDPAPPRTGSTATPRTSSGNNISEHAWGCGATDGTATGRSWGARNKTAASYRALAECAQRSTRGRTAKLIGHCRVVSCSPSIKTYYDAHLAWFAR